MRSDRGYYDDESFGGRKIHIGHVVLYIGDGKIIHSQKSAGMVIEQNLDELIKEPNYEIALIKRPVFWFTGSYNLSIRRIDEYKSFCPSPKEFFQQHLFGCRRDAVGVSNEKLHKYASFFYVAVYDD